LPQPAETLVQSPSLCPDKFDSPSSDPYNDLTYV
jgi:hypothetical protein